MSGRRTSPVSVSAHVGRRVRRERHDLAWSQRALAVQCERRGWAVCESALSDIENGGRAVTADELVILADVFGLDPADLLDGAA